MDADYKETNDIKIESKCSGIEMAKEVFRTIRHSFGYTDQIYYNLLKVKGIVQITSKRGGIDIDNNGAAVDSSDSSGGGGSGGSSSSSGSGGETKERRNSNNHSSSSNNTYHHSEHFSCDTMTRKDGKTLTIMGISDYECDNILS